MFKKLVFTLFVVLVFVALTSCERNVLDQKNGKVLIQIPSFQKAEQSSKLKINPLGQGASPVSWSDVDCVGFFVSGPETTMSTSKCEVFNGRTASRLEDLVFGSVHAGYYSGETAEITVPAGNDRIITAIGFKTNLTAANGAAAACKNVLKSENNSFSSPFVFATSAKFNVEPNSIKTISLPISYVSESTPFIGDCSGPNAPGSGGSSAEQPGPPVSLRIRFQDNLTSILLNSCVAVSFDLLDAKGQLAAVDDDYRFSITTPTSSLEFYNPDVGSRICDSGTAGTSKTVDFFDGTRRFPRNVLFVKPISAVAANNFSVTKLLPSATPIFTDIQNFSTVFQSTISPDFPFKINFFDVKSFRSSNSSTASNPIEVSADDCRTAVVQVLDNQNRPLKIFNFGPSAGNFITSSVGFIAPSLSFLQFSTDQCATMVNSQTYQRNYGESSIAGLNIFNYKIASGYKGERFNFKVNIGGFGYYDSSNPYIPLDPTSTDNNKSFFKVKN